MMLNKWILSTALALTCVATTAFADGLEDMHPRQLQNAVVIAVENNDRRDLMALMQEMQRRGMWIFKTPEQKLCWREPEKIGILNVGAFRIGTAKVAYTTFLKMHMLETQDCGCLGPSHSYDEFLMEMFDTTAAEMTEEQFKEMQDWKNANQYSVNDDYRSFRSEFCSG